MRRKHPTSDIKRYHTTFLQLGLIGSLAIFIVAANIDLVSTNTIYDPDHEPEIPTIEEIPVTNKIETPPPPLRPPVPVTVPDDFIIEDVDIDLYPNLDLSDRFEPMPPEQVKDEEENHIFEFVEHMPELIGGMASIHRNIQYPEMARRAGIEGTVHIEFIVNERGEVENPRVVRGIGGGADEEALRAVEQAQFRPGMQRGRPVPVRYTIPVVFRLQN